MRIKPRFHRVQKYIDWLINYAIQIDPNLLHALVRRSPTLLKMVERHVLLRYPPPFADMFSNHTSSFRTPRP